MAITQTSFDSARTALVRLFLVAALLGAVAPTQLLAQADTAEATATQTAETAVASPDEPEAEKPADQQAPATTSSTDAATPAADDAPTKATEAAAEADAPVAPPTNWGMVAAWLGALVLPILIGRSMSKSLRMPDYAWKISLILAAVAFSSIIVATGEFKGGPDLSGGITLVYELAGDAEGAAIAAAADEAQKQADDEAADADSEEEATTDNDAEARPRVDIDRLIDALQQRVDPTGAKEVSIRNYGGAIEIIIPKASGDDLDYIKRRITDLGQLEFRIPADPRRSEDERIIEKSLALSPSEKLLVENGTPRAEWVEYVEEEFPDDDPRIVRRQAGNRREALMLRDRYDVTGEYLTLAAMGRDDVGRPTVDFTFNNSGARRFGKLTGDNLPNEATGAFRHLGILLDKRLISAPRLNDRITSRGTISGASMTEDEVAYTISILNAGSLPAALNKTPISEETISPTLGATTIEKGKWAIGSSLVAVLAFMLLYYRFAGFVACLALAGTLLLLLAAMVQLQAAFTLPGLAGIVLTVGMSVDANVLIFERIREELKKGASLRMAIRNGFDRATTTIIDSNVTTLIAGLLLYAVGTGPIKGFGVTLILGILMSMFTAIFCSRVIFDVAERKGWLRGLAFASAVSNTNIDFLGKRYLAAAASLALIGLGLAGVFGRGENLLNIDFTGGSSVTMVLKKDASAPIAEIRKTLETTELADKNLLVVELGESDADAPSTRYTISSSLDDVDAAEDLIAETFGDKLQTYSVKLGSVKSFTETGGFSGHEIPLEFNKDAAFGETDGVSHDTVIERVQQILTQQGAAGELPQLVNDNYTPGSSQRFRDWTLRLGLDEAKTLAVGEALRDQLTAEPVFPLANKIGGRVAGDMQVKAINAIVVSLLCIIGYLWFRFQNVSFGLAAVVALVHDVLVTLGAIALSSYIVSSVPALAKALQIDAFQLSLPMIAAFITIIGYSLNDTIVIFDRIREVRGKSPRLTAEMVNKSVNQTLARTLLTSLTTLIVVVILYFYGGAGIHDFAFALVVGVIAGTYSTVFVANPVLLWLLNRNGDGTTVGGGAMKSAA
ncbi:protein translocase subunit SecD [Botrimarina hoheduenensis]|uniref:Multifunctional fusion protein n=1 Tax=Botrimarina hoheduenensis TaxID=2528000 RepID=A0A5C5WDS1_9BACT|nr:protein translocase subunit SecD [Botrimarina hoheduenensis]TWT48283.1 bifunctional preprotein translocase subunit SecD/SecF [Botrimarina hoheduenensis]